MNQEEFLKIIKAYRTSEDRIMRLYDIFIQGDTRYLDPFGGAKVAGFLDNNAISIEQKKIKKCSVKIGRIKDPQKEMKAFTIDLLKKDGYKIVSIERAFRGLIPDVLARKGDETIAVECGPCFITKAIEYLKEPKTCLWILRPENGYYTLFTVKRSRSWDSFLKFHNQLVLDTNRKHIDKVWKPMERHIPRVLTSLEIAAMFKAAEKNKRDLMLLKCMYFLGLRNSEVQQMKTGDINAINKTLRVIKDDKGREIPIPEGFFDELKDFIKDREGYVFTGRSNGLISDRHIRRIAKKYAKLANVRKYDEIHPHTLRHTYAAHLRYTGVPLSEIRVLLGHVRMETTSIYNRVGSEKVKERIERVFSDFG